MKQPSEDNIWQVWGKARVFGTNDPVLWRMDECGAWIFRSHYGLETEYGWVMDHVRPLPRGGTEDISNLHPVHWRNANRRADGSLECRVIAHRDNNVEIVQDG